MGGDVRSLACFSSRSVLNVLSVKFLKNLVFVEDDELKDSYKQLERLVQQEEALMLHQIAATTSGTLTKLGVMESKADKGIAATMRTEDKTDRVLTKLTRKAVPRTL